MLFMQDVQEFLYFLNTLMNSVLLECYFFLLFFEFNF